MKTFITLRATATAVACLALWLATRDHADRTESQCGDKPETVGLHAKRQRPTPLPASGHATMNDLLDRFLSVTDISEKARIGDELVAHADESAFQAFAEALLAENDPERRAELAACLDRVRSRPILQMTATLLTLTDDPVIIEAVRRTIARMADGDTVDHLIDLHGEDSLSKTRRQAVCETVAEIRNPEAVPALSVVVDSAYPDRLAAAAIESLTAIGSPEACAVFLEAFDSIPYENFTLRNSVVRALGGVKNPGARDFIEGLVDDDCIQPLFREAAREALTRLPASSSYDLPSPSVPDVVPPKFRG